MNGNSGFLGGFTLADFPPPEQPGDNPKLIAVLCEISVSLRAIAKDISVLRAMTERAVSVEAPNTSPAA